MAIRVVALLLSVGATLEAGTSFAIVALLALNLLIFVVRSHVGLIATILILAAISSGGVSVDDSTVPGWTERLGVIGLLVLAALAVVSVQIATGVDRAPRWTAITEPRS